VRGGAARWERERPMKNAGWSVHRGRGNAGEVAERACGRRSAEVRMQTTPRSAA
jgi:hypothetical protein